MKHKVKKQIDELRQMLKDLEPVDDIRDQAGKIENSCVEVRDKLQKHNIAISTLPLIINTAITIRKEGYNTNDLQVTLELCDQMEELYVSIEKKLDELEKKIAQMIFDQKEQASIAKKALEKLEEQKELVEEFEKVF